MKKYAGLIYIIVAFVLFDIGQYKENKEMINMALFAVYIYLLPFLFVFLLNEEEIKRIKEKRENKPRYRFFLAFISFYFGFELAAYEYFITAFLLILSLFVLEVFFGSKKEYK